MKVEISDVVFGDVLNGLKLYSVVLIVGYKSKDTSIPHLFCAKDKSQLLELVIKYSGDHQLIEKNENFISDWSIFRYTEIGTVIK